MAVLAIHVWMEGHVIPVTISTYVNVDQALLAPGVSQVMEQLFI